MKVALYARVSTTDKDQNPEVQLKQLRDYCERMEWNIQREYVDKASAVDYEHRVAWSQMMKEASTRQFDTLLVFRMSRAFRSMIHTYTSLEMLSRYAIDFRSLTEPEITTKGPMGKLTLAIIGALAEYEREEIQENVRAGMAYAKEHGTKSGKAIGRPRAPFDFANVCNAYLIGKKSYTEAARILSEGQKRPVTAGFVFNRIKREAAARGILPKKSSKKN